MDRKKFLLGAVFSLMIIGFVGVLTPFVSSLTPNAKADSALERIDISQVPKGKFKIIKAHPIHSQETRGFEWSLMIYRKLNGELRIWDIAVRPNGDVGLPDIYWFNPYWPCGDFGPGYVNGVIDESLPITCRDQVNKDSWGRWMQWDLDGKAISKSTPDLNPIKGKIEGKYFVLNKSGS